LSRPGRFDVKVTFLDATPGQAEQLFKHFYHARGTPASGEDNEKLIIQAREFSDCVFRDLKLSNGEDVKVSMAALQGFLLQHKSDGGAAVAGAEAWARGLKTEQEARLRVRLERIEAKAKKEEAPLTPVSTTT
jgi:hypothetical protein